MPNRYKLDAPVQTASSSLVVSFYGPNPTKTSCDFCRSRKRKCNGSVRECGKFKEGASVPASDPGSSKARRVASPSSSSSLPGKKRKRSLTATTVESDLIQISPSAYDDELSFPREQSYSLAEPSLDPLILFLDSIGVYDYVFDTKESYIGFRKPSREEDHVIERFCTSSHFYPFEVFKRFSLGHQMETMPHMLRYAFYAYCCRMSVPPAPTQISEKFYTLAKESMNWCMDNPSLTSLQALMLMNITAACFGDHPGRYKYRNMAFRMVF
ncbi:hypothetical protein BC829DRAFT_67351 [Chytridium lagenaria]|nr:hypothetical protein BC829DRAFT_67351 [Chytridium lagenaria]